MNKAWTADELERIGKAEELNLSSLRGDGSLRKPVTMWVVRLGQDLYVRSVNGRDGVWYRGAQDCHEAQIDAGGVKKDVSLVEESDPEINGRIDALYRDKYRRCDANDVESIVAEKARAATLRLLPMKEIS